MRVLVISLFLMIAMAFAGLASAQTAATTDEVDSLVKVLEDDAARAKLISKIKEASSESAQASPDIPVSLKLPQGAWRRFAEHLREMSVGDYAQALGVSLAVLLLAWGLGRLLIGGVARGVAWLSRHEERMPGLAERAGRYRPFMNGFIHLAVAVAALLGVLASFDVDVLAWLDGAQGRDLIWKGVTIFLVLAAALVLWELAGAALNGVLNRLDGQGRRHGRMKTLAPMLRMLVGIVLTVMTALIVLSELGVNIAPLLAGAGMVGLAVGLGAQKLVQDLIGSVSMLLEDTLAVGDVVKIGDHAGVIEKMTLMDIQLRDISGYLHVIPFSKIDAFVNMTVDYAYAVFDIGIAYSADADRVMKLLGELGLQMSEDEEFGQLIQEPLEMLGLDRFDDSAVILKARLKTEPGKQWAVMREFNRRMKKLFDEQGIEIPFPQMVVWKGDK